MFLAIKEIFYHRGRYRLVVAVVFLITYMVFFLSSLSVGLARLNRLALDNWQASSVVLSEYANNNLTASTLSETDYKAYLTKENIAELGQMAVVASQEGKAKKVNAQVFGLTEDSFLAPPIVAGRKAQEFGELVADKSIEQKGLALGDTIQLNGSKKTYKIVGFTQNNSFFTQPVLFMSLDDLRELKYGSAKVKNSSLLVVKDQEKISGQGLKQISLATLIKNIPGYQAQVLTFSFMIGAMVVITALVLGIFIYIITIQKIHLYGIMRAQGISSRTIIASIFWQIFILVSLGMGLAMLMLVVTQQFLPASMPFYSDWQAYALLTLVMLLMSLLGGFLSIHKVSKIDPIVAIGGD
ncbi:ABC transporter permease [Streptococcus massiliensis]|uniref:Putative hemin transport system permease protein HrtB n=1 Tax=Streptococcus massiliensis TaxID=313439 RepID=A0A380L2R1_9STRE|nr:ABC transporter permease [Streptococcus massiliensis]SUN77547.1 permease domain protein [Streptococcus massiliensis]